jgi:hypothetical protein
MTFWIFAVIYGAVAWAVAGAVWRYCGPRRSSIAEDRPEPRSLEQWKLAAVASARASLRRRGIE